MTAYEKVGQLVQYSSYAALTGPGGKDASTKAKHDRIRNGGVGSLLNVVTTDAAREAQELAVNNSRLGIPLLLGYDVIHGFKTMFPVPLGESASWDMEAVEQSARIAATEAAAAGIHWTFSPMVDISRDARWGRVMEGSGEDPYLVSQIAVAKVKGYQGDDLADPATIASCPKHFAGYGYAEAGRDYNTVDVSDHTLWNVILPPFKAAVDAGAVTFMTSFNEIGGVPSTGNESLVREILKERWGFEGLVVSDWGSIAEMIPHGYAADRKDASLIALRSGVDMDMEGNCYEAFAEELVKSEAIPQRVLDDAVRRVLRVKFELGIMDDPFKYINAERERTRIYSDAHREIARDVARKSIVLLQNTDNILPLNRNSGRIALIGPLAKDKDTPLGNWRGQAITNSAVSVYEGLAQVVGEERIAYAEGCRLVTSERSFAHEVEIEQKDTSGFAAARGVAAGADVVIMVLGEDSQQTGEGRSQADIRLSGLQQELLESVYSVNKRVVVVLMNGRPLELSWMAAHVPGIVETWHAGSEAGSAIADVLFGDFNPSGRLPMSFPRSIGQLPLYYAQKPTGRPGPLEKEVFWSHYTDERNDALFPFGFGLSYTTFQYGPPELSSALVTEGGTVQVSVNVTNSGTREGREVVQLYLHDRVASVTRPLKELKAFRLIHLKPGETKKVVFNLSNTDFSFYTKDGRQVVEPGEFDVYVGGSSDRTQEARMTLKARTDSDM